MFYKLHVQSPTSAPGVEFCLQISNDLSWRDLYHGKDLQREWLIQETADNDVASVININSSKPCQGNLDDKFMALLPSRKAEILLWYVILCAYECNSTYFILLPIGQHVVAYEDDIYSRIPHDPPKCM